MRKAHLPVVAAVAALALGGAAYAAIPGSDGVVHGCYAKSGGALRVIDASVTNCKSGETSLNWNQKGSTGAQGPAGPQGPKGDPGAGSRGPTGPSGPAGQTGFTDTLPSGKTLMGTYAGQGSAFAPGAVYVPISFGIPLATAPSAHFVPKNAVNPPECPGSAASPTAAPGSLCVYEHSSESAETFLFDPGTGTKGTGVYGTVLLIVVCCSGDVFTSSGTWAVTAP
jgi:hypothetical protein